MTDLTVISEKASSSVDDIQELYDDIFAAVRKHKNRMPLATIIGTFEFAKHQLLTDPEGEE